MDPDRPPPIHLNVRLELPDKEPRTFEYDFEQPVITLGRDPANDIQVPLTTVSRHHARIFYEHGDYFLEDLGSTHGTKHNDRTIGRGEKRLLRSGDTIAIVSFHITFDTPSNILADRQPGERTEQLARRMVQEVLSSLGTSDAERPSLRIMNGPSEGRRFQLADDAAEVVIGRSPDCDITLEDHNISRRHCLIKRSWHGFTAQDLGSRNGVLVNSQEIDGLQMLRDGDEIQVGGVKLTFIDPPSRLLEQMGGLGAEADPGGQQQTMDAAADDLALDEDPGADAEDLDQYGGAEDDLEPSEQGVVGPPPFEPSAEPERDGLSGLDLPDEDRKALEAASSSGGMIDMAILAIGIVFLLGIVGVALLLFL